MGAYNSTTQRVEHPTYMTPYLEATRRKLEKKEAETSLREAKDRADMPPPPRPGSSPGATPEKARYKSIVPLPPPNIPQGPKPPETDARPCTPPFTLPAEQQEPLEQITPPSIGLKTPTSKRKSVQTPKSIGKSRVEKAPATTISTRRKTAATSAKAKGKQRANNSPTAVVAPPPLPPTPINPIHYKSTDKNSIGNFLRTIYENRDLANRVISLSFSETHDTLPNSGVIALLAPTMIKQGDILHEWMSSEEDRIIAMTKRANEEHPHNSPAIFKVAAKQLEDLSRLFGGMENVTLTFVVPIFVSLFSVCENVRQVEVPESWDEAFHCGVAFPCLEGEKVFLVKKERDENGKVAWVRSVRACGRNKKA